MKSGGFMLKKLFSVMIIVLSFLIQSCSTYITVKVLKPAEVNIPSAKKISVTDFTFRGNWDFHDTTTISDIAAQALANYIFGTQPEEYDPLNTFPGYEISDKLTTKLMENGHFKIVRREQNARENNVFFTDTQAARLGLTMGVDVIIVGSGNYNIKDSGYWIEDIKVKNNIKIKNKKYQISRYVDTGLTYRIIDVSTAKLIASKTNYDQEYSSAEGENENAAKDKLEDWRKIVNRQIDYILEKSVRQIAPHYVWEEREIKSGTSQEMKDALEYAKKDLWEDAKKLWEYVNNDYSYSKEDKLFANYNLGIYNEINGNYDEAEAYFELCFIRSGKSEYLSAKSRVQKRKLEVQKLMLQK